MALPYCSPLPVNVESRRRAKWDAGKESLLIDFFQDNRLLWDDTHHDYFRQDMKTERLSELRQFLGFDGQGIPFREEDIKTKWKVLRGSYYRELRKQDRCKALWSAASKPYVPRWVHFDRMHFVRHAYCTRASISSLRRASLSVVTNAALQVSTLDGESGDSLAACEEIPSDSHTVGAPSDPRNLGCLLISQAPRVRKRRRGSVAGRSRAGLPHHTTGGDPQPRLQLPHDANDAFGVHVALMLKSLPPRQCDLVKMDILKVFFKHKYSSNDDGEVNDGFSM